MSVEANKKSTEEVSSKRLHGDERRQQIIRASIEVFSMCGCRGATTKEIAAAAGVSEATVFKHFANKDELYSAILDAKACEPMMQNPFEALKPYEEKGDDFGFFYTAALTILKNHRQDVDFIRLMMHSALEGHELATMFLQNFAGNFYEYFSNYIARRQKDGAFRAVESRLAIRAFLGMIVHHSLNNILWDKEMKLLQISDETAARGFTELLLSGIKK
jgi:AcrR family transcriptional regulator